MKRVVVAVLVLMVSLTLITNANEVSDWAKSDVQLVFQSDLIGETYFDNYQRPITRQEYGYLMYQLYEYLSGQPIAYDIDLSKSYAFSDTSDLYLIALQGIGLIEGYPEGGSYKPDALISREEIMTLYIRLLEMRGYVLEESQTVYDDESTISGWAKVSVKKCIATGLVKGRANGVIDPKGNATVQESLVVLSRIISSKRFEAGQVSNVSSGNAIVSNGYYTYAVNYDLLGNPLGIELYRDYDYIGNVVSGFVTDHLWMEGSTLYYIDEFDSVRHYPSAGSNNSTITYDKASKSLTINGQAHTLIKETPDRITVSNQTLMYGGGEVLSQILKDFVTVNDQLIYLEDDGNLRGGYNMTKKEGYEFGHVECDAIHASGNYFVTISSLYNNGNHTRYMPIFDIRRFTGN